MTDRNDKSGDNERGTTDLDALRPPSPTTEPVQESVELPEAITESDGESESERDPLDVPRAPTPTTNPTQDPVEPTWRESGDSEADGNGSESDADAEDDGV